jgi:phage-related protein
LSITVADLLVKVSGDTGDAQSKIKGLRGEVGGLGEDMTKGSGASGGLFGALGGLVNPASLLIGGIGALGGGLIAATKAAADEAVGVNRLSATLKSSAKDWDGNTSALDDYITKQQNLAFDDGDIRDSLNVLVRSTGSLSEAQKLQAIAEDTARAKGISLAEATDIVNAANSGKLAGLKKLGVEIDTSTTKEQAFSQLQGLVAGQAQAYAGTAAGSMDRMHTALGNAVEDIGGVLLPKVTQALGGVANFISSPGFQAGFETLVNILGTVLGGAFDILGNAINFVMPILQFLFNLISGFFAQAQGAGNPLAPVTDGLSQLAGLIQATVQPILEAIFVQLARFWIEIQPKLEAVWTEIQAVIQTVWPIIQSVLQAGLQFVFDLWNNVWPGIQQVLSGVWDVIQGVVKVAWGIVSGIISAGLSLLSGDWAGAWAAIQQALGLVWEGIQQIISGAWTAIQGLFNIVLGELKTVWDTAWNAISQTVTDIWNNITRWVGEQIDAVKAKIDLVTGAIKLVWTQFWDGVGQKVSDIWNALVLTVATKFLEAQAKIKEITDGIGTAWTTFWDSVGTTLKTAWDGVVSTVKTKIGEVQSFLAGVPAQVLSTVQSIGSSIVDGIINGIRASWDKITGIIAGLAQNLPQPIKDALGIHSPSKEMADQVGDPMMQGIVLGAQNAMPQLLGAMRELALAIVTVWRAQFDPQNGDGVAFTVMKGWTDLTDWFRYVWSVKFLDILKVTLTEIRLAVQGEAAGFNEAGHALGGAIIQGILAELEAGKSLVAKTTGELAGGSGSGSGSGGGGGNNNGGGNAGNSGAQSIGLGTSPLGAHGPGVTNVFQAGAITIEVKDGRGLLDALRAAGVPLTRATI